MIYWIKPYNHSDYRVSDFIRDYGYIDWGVRNHFASGDQVLLYATSPECRVTHILEVGETGMTSDEITEDSRYYLSQEAYDLWRRHKDDMTYVRLYLVVTVETPVLHLYELRAHGLNSAPRSARRLTPETVAYVRTVTGCP